MSNSIWKTPEENPDANKGFACYKSNLSLVENNRYLQNGAVKPDREWGYVKEIIAQADNAERLLEIAKRQNDILQDHFATLGYSIGKEVMDMSEEIEQLIEDE